MQLVLIYTLSMQCHTLCTMFYLMEKILPHYCVPFTYTVILNIKPASYLQLCTCNSKKIILFLCRGVYGTKVSWLWWHYNHKIWKVSLPHFSTIYSQSICTFITQYFEEKTLSYHLWMWLQYNNHVTTIWKHIIVQQDTPVSYTSRLN